jgi:hypothetical protein
LPIGCESHCRIYLEVVNDNAYEKWNQALATYCLLSNVAHSQVSLTISSHILAAAWAKSHRVRFTSEEAEKDFIAAVSELYRREVAPTGLLSLNEIGHSGLPRSIAFLGLSVLAALAMGHEESLPVHAYYPRLGDLLGYNQNQGFPPGFTPEDFKQLWLYLRQWLKKNHNIALAWPERKVGPFHIVALPLSHAPLRKIDLQKLPAFFAANRYQPGVSGAPQRLERDFMRWVGSAQLTAFGLQAFNDGRREQVLAQVAYELEAWDGVVEEPDHSHVAPVELLLDLPRRQPELSYWPRRPHIFPEMFEDKQHDRIFESCEEGWYDPVVIPPEDGQQLARGFIWEMQYSGKRLRLRRGETHVVALAPSVNQDQTGFVSRWRLPLNIKCAVLCRRELETAVSLYLRSITGRPRTPITGRGVPHGWQLYIDVKPVQPIPLVSPVLEPISVETDIDIFPVGGLRVGQRQWIAGAPPRLHLSGTNTPLAEATIDGEKIDVAADGSLLDNGLLANPGAHIAVCADAQLTIEVLNPALTYFADKRETESKGSFAVLPPGRWTVIGAACHELLYCRSSEPNGVVVRTRFNAVWAVNSAPTREAKIVCFTPAPPPPIFPIYLSAPQRRLAIGWAKAVLSPHTLQPRIGCFDAASGARLMRGWKTYVAAAQSMEASLQRHLRNNDEC